MKKRFITVIITVALVMCIGVSAMHIESEQFPPVERQILHEQLVNDVAITRIVDSYEMIQQLKVQAQQSRKVIPMSEIERMEDQILEATFEAATWPNARLEALGFDPVSIANLRNLTGKETLAELSQLRVLDEFACYNTLSDHYYDQSENKTYFVVDYGWEWVRGPVVALTDCVGVGWNNSFHPTNDLAVWHNRTYLGYVSYTNADNVEYEYSRMIEDEINTSQAQIDIDRGDQRYLQLGYGTMALSQTGQVNDAKFAFKYGHNRIGLAPSIAYPWGVGFTFEGSEVDYSPASGIVYSDFASLAR